MSEQWLTTEEAARVLDCSARHVRRLCTDGSLVWERQGSRQMLIDAESVQSWNEKETTQDQETDFDEDVEETTDVPQEPVENIDSPLNEEDDVDYPPHDIEELKLQEAMGDLDQKLKKRLGDENKYVSDVQQALDLMINRFTAERNRNRRIQMILQKLLAELQIPLSENKPSLWRRIFRRR